jgi:hypothetical protein
MAKKTLNFDLFKLACTNQQHEPLKFEALLDDKSAPLVALPRGAGQVIIEGDIVKRGNFYFGTLAQIHMNDLPPAYDISTLKLEDLPLRPTQGLAYPTSFLFDKELQMIAFESKKNGVGLQSFCEFYERNFQVPQIETQIVIDPIEMQRLNDMTIIKKFQVKVAKVVNGEVFNQRKKSFKQIIASADGTNTNTLEYILTSERGKSTSLKVTKIKQMTRELLQFRENEEVEKLVITGKEDEDNASRAIDFIANKVRLKFSVERERFSSAFSTSEKYEKLEEEYADILPSLRKAYKTKKI